MQHPVYLKAINERLGTDNVGIVQVPTPPMGLYGGKLTTLGTPAAGTVVSVPNQPSNEYRAVLVLESLGWVKIKPDSDPATFSQRNIVANPYKIVLKEMDNAQQVRALPDVDYGLIQGNFAVSSGMALTSALKLEAATSHFINVVTVAGKNQMCIRDRNAGVPSAAAARSSALAPAASAACLWRCARTADRQTSRAGASAPR